MVALPLNFDQIRKANLTRLPLFKNRIGGPAHEKPDGSDWSLSDWTTALVGEVGEFASKVKRIRSGDTPFDQAAIEYLTKELADIFSYTDLLAIQLRVNLGEAVRLKFNEVSQRLNIPVLIGPDGELQMPEGFAQIEQPLTGSPHDSKSFTIRWNGDKLPNLREVQRQYLAFLLQKTGAKKKASDIAGIDRKTMYRYMTTDKKPLFNPHQVSMSYE